MQGAVNRLGVLKRRLWGASLGGSGPPIAAAFYLRKPPEVTVGEAARFAAALRSSVTR